MGTRKASAKIINPRTTTSEKRYGKNGEYDAAAVQDFVAAVRDKGYQPTKEEQAVIDEYIADAASGAKSEPRVETKAHPKNAKANAAGQLDLPDLSEGAASAVSDVGKGEDNTRTVMEKAGVQAQNVKFEPDTKTEWKPTLKNPLNREEVPNPKAVEQKGAFYGSPVMQSLTNGGSAPSILAERGYRYDGKKYFDKNGKELSERELYLAAVDDAMSILDRDKITRDQYNDAVNVLAQVSGGHLLRERGNPGVAESLKIAFGGKGDELNRLTNLAGTYLGKNKDKIDAHAERLGYEPLQWTEIQVDGIGRLRDADGKRIETGGDFNIMDARQVENRTVSGGKESGAGDEADGGAKDSPPPLTIDAVRKMTPEGYQDSDITAAQVVQVMKDAGLSKEEAIKELARLSSTSKTGTISDIGMGALNSIYGAGRDAGGDGADNAAQVAREPSSTPIRDEVIADDESGALAGMQRAREGIAEELLANADDPKLREELTKYVDEVRRNYQAVEPETRNLVYMNMFDAYKKGLWGDPKSDDPQERKEAKLGLTFAILGQLGKIMSQFGKDVGKIGGHDIGGEIGPTAFDTIQRKGIEQAMEERRQYREGKLKAEMDAAGFGPELQAQALETFAKWKNNPETMPLAQALEGNKQLYAFQMSQILGDRLMKDPTVAQLVGLMALGKIDGEAVKGVLMTRTGQEVVGMLKDWADKNPNGLFSGFIGNVAGKAASIIGE